jgi:DNA recombination protein RmuC
MDMMVLIYVIAFLTVLNLVISVLLWRRKSSTSAESNKEALHDLQNSIREELQRNRSEQSEEARLNRSELSTSMQEWQERVLQKQESIARQSDEKALQNAKEGFQEYGARQTENHQLLSENLKHIESTIEKQLKAIREDNERQLNAMRHTVDEKLQNTLEKRLGESFKQVSERLEQVHKGLGEMQSVAAGVGDLKKVLSNVKTRGTLGEYQLEAILEQMLAPEQYAKNVATKKGSRAVVEFAIKLPGNDSDSEIWVPVDSKFPMEDYNRLLDALEAGDVQQSEQSQKALLQAIENFAKDISDKYIDPPHTSDFAIMFLPAEGLYAEVLRHPQLFELLQNKYKITITGPTTLAAFLSSLQMGFRTLAVQKRSSEVWDILKGVKAEFGKFGGVLEKVQKQLTTASGTLETLRTTRTSVLEKKLKDVESSDLSTTEDLLPLPKTEKILSMDASPGE